MISKKKIVLYVVAGLAVVTVIFTAGFFIGKSQGVIKVDAPANQDFSLFWDAYNKLHENYIDKSKIDEKKLIYGAIAGMTQSLGDPYTSFFDPEQAKIFEADLAGSFGGVGIEVAVRKEQLTVITALKDTPAYKAGIKSGDLIIKINGKSTSDISTDQAVSLIRGKKGTQVTLTIFREEWKEGRDFTLVRDTIKIPSIDWEMKDGDIAYIHMYQFDQTLASSFNKIAREILKSSAKKIILDLRDNPGGYLDICQEVAGWFLKPGQILTVEDFGPTNPREEFKVDGTASFSDYPVVVLINKGSASASEILAGALRDNRNVQLVGEKSFGKGSVQEVAGLQDGQTFLKITIAKWLTPRGASISEVGLTPDVKVSLTDADIAANKDPQLEKALEIIRNIK